MFFIKDLMDKFCECPNCESSILISNLKEIKAIEHEGDTYTKVEIDGECPDCKNTWVFSMLINLKGN